MIQNRQLGRLLKAVKTASCYQLFFDDEITGRLYIVSPHIFRLQVDPTGQFEKLQPSLLQLSDNADPTAFNESRLLTTDEAFTIQAGQLELRLQRRPALLSIYDERIHRNRFAQAAPLAFTSETSSEFLKQSPNEFYYGGGMQNGRFSHKGKKIAIKNTNLAGNGAVAAPVPFFWSNAGFGELRNTWQPGSYDFGARNNHAAILTHADNVFDAFYLIGDTPAEILQRYYFITGRPLLLPAYAYGLGQLSNFTDFHWAEAKAQDRTALKFSDGKYYLPADSGQAASLNNDDPFSAKSMIKTYQDQKLPLSWLGVDFLSAKQADSDEAAAFAQSAQDAGVQAVFTAPHENASALLASREAAKPGYARLFMALDQMKQEAASERPLLLSENGWAGSQRLAATTVYGDGGDWAIIKHGVASLLSLSLSGQPNVGMAIDGLYGGGNAQVNLRDLEWKTFTPLLFFADGKGRLAKTAFAYNHKLTKVAGAYLNLRQRLRYELYSLALASQAGESIVRPLFLDYPHEKINYTEQSDHEFMLGRNFLVAPIMSGRENQNGFSVKDRLYLPDRRTTWTDFFTGQKYMGGQVYNNLLYAGWHLPVFVPSGAIIKTSASSFLLYPGRESQRVFYQDNPETKGYREGQLTKQAIKTSLQDRRLRVEITPVEGNFDGFAKNQSLTLNILLDDYPGNIVLKANQKPLNLPHFGNAASFEAAQVGVFYNQDFVPAQEMKKMGAKAQPALQVKLPQSDLTATTFVLTIDNCSYGADLATHAITDSALRTPQKVQVDPDKVTAHSIALSWEQLPGSQAQLQVDGLLYTNLPNNHFIMHDLEPDHVYQLRIRTLRQNKVSDWSELFRVKTKPDQLNYAIRGIKVDSTLPAAADHPLDYLTDLLTASSWLTATPADPDHGHYEELTFDFGEKINLSRMVYVPRSVDRRGHLLRVQIATSTDGENFSDWSQEYNWPNDAKNKVIGLRDVTAQAIKLRVLASQDNLASAKEIFFFRKK